MASKEVKKWQDEAMFEAEEINADDGPQVRLISCTPDPLGEIAFAALGYVGKFGMSLADVTDEERRHYLHEIQKTAIAAPMEFVDLHFVISGVTRGFTHQMVRQRTAVYVQESTRFAVKDGANLPVGRPPELEGTVSRAQWRKELSEEWQGQYFTEGDWKAMEEKFSGEAQKARFKWDAMVDAIGEFYDEMVNSGALPAESARGILPTNLLTQINYKTNLRNFVAEGGKRLCTQAQFEWRAVFAQMLKAMVEYGKDQTYLSTDDGRLKPKSSQWQFEEIAKIFKPACYLQGSCQFDASFDRKCSIKGRVNDFAANNIPSSEWYLGYQETAVAPNGAIVDLGIPPIHPAEWLLDHKAAR